MPFQNKPVILVAHQFAGDALANFNATVRQLKVSLYEKAFSPTVLSTAVILKLVPGRKHSFEFLNLICTNCFSWKNNS